MLVCECEELFTLTPLFPIIILMLTNPLLQAKYEAQMRLDKEANHDLKQYVENSHRKVAELARKYGFTIRYGKIEVGYSEAEPEELTLESA